MSNFHFTLRLKVSPFQRLQSDETTIQLSNLIDGKDVKIRSAEYHENGEPRPFKWSTIIERKAADFNSFEDAHQTGLQFRDAMIVAASASQVWLDFGNDRSQEEVTQDLIQPVGAQSRLHSDRIGLFVHRGAFHVGGGFGAFIVASGATEQLVDSLRRAVRKGISLTDTQRLALELYGLAHFESSLRAQFVVLMSVIEVLAERKSRPIESQALIEEFIKQSQSASIDAEQKKSLRHALQSLRQEAISKACRRIIQYYLDNDAVSDFIRLYELRSRLLHEGNPPSGSIGLGVEATALTTLISRLVQAMFVT
jgi:hypothetical protein